MKKKRRTVIIQFFLTVKQWGKIANGLYLGSAYADFIKNHFSKSLVKPTCSPVAAIDFYISGPVDIHPSVHPTFFFVTRGRFYHVDFIVKTRCGICLCINGLIDWKWRVSAFSNSIGIYVIPSKAFCEYLSRS